jgi:hypothetical protein
MNFITSIRELLYVIMNVSISQWDVEKKENDT